ncbi:Thiol:disulfide interchange protein TlpA [bacterium HR30]|nr:Thiol:disulfide interchange protein TlpA [bacterium HR30]
MAILKAGSRLRHLVATLLAWSWTLSCTLLPTVEIQQGKPFPNVLLEDAEGNAVALDLKSTGDNIVLVWATWCPPCHEALPGLWEAVKGLPSSQRPNFILWNIDRDPNTAKAFLRQRIPNLGDAVIRFDPEGRQFQRLGAPGMPATFVVMGGIVRAVFVGYQPAGPKRVLQILQAAQAKPANGTKD